MVLERLLELLISEQDFEWSMIDASLSKSTRMLLVHMAEIRIGGA